MVRFCAHSSHGLSRHAVVVALVLAVFVRALIPAGYMLSPQVGFGLAGLVICSAKAVKGEAAGTSEHDKAPPGGADNFCGFATAVANSVPPPFELTVAYVALLDSVPALALKDAATSAFDSGPPLGARGPPAKG